MFVAISKNLFGRINSCEIIGETLPSDSSKLRIEGLISDCLCPVPRIFVDKIYIVCTVVLFSMDLNNLGTGSSLEEILNIENKF